MITLVVYEDVFDPTRRRVSQLPRGERRRVSDFVPPEMEGVTTAAWLNGRFVLHDDPPVADGDFIHFAAPPTGFLVPVLPYLFAAFAVAVFGGMILKRLMPKEEPVQDNLGGSTYSYYGFRNAYRPEGDAIPVVYGTMRVAPPCINQSVTGYSHYDNSSYDFTDNSLQTGTFERLNALYAVSHGPILGFGQYKADVFNHADWQDQINGNYTMAAGLKFQINGVDGQHLNTKFTWRTGGNTQDSLSDALWSYVKLPVTNPGVAYDLAFEIDYGTPGISKDEFAPGVYTYGTQIEDLFEHQHISQLLKTTADLCDVQLLWEKGLYTLDSDDGSWLNKSALVRIQYYRTDVTGVSTSDVVVLPQFKITQNVPSPFSVDIPFTLYDPDTYVPPAQQGYAKLISDSNYRLINTNEDGAVRMRPGTTGLEPDLKFTFACWASIGSIEQCRNMWLLSWTNSVAEIDDDLDAFSGGCANIDAPNGWAGNGMFFGIRLFVDSAGVLGTAWGVHVVIIAYERRSPAGTSDTYYAGSWWVTETPLGTTESGAGSWPGGGTAPQEHITVAYDGDPLGDGSGWSETGGSGEFRVWAGGNAHTVRKGKAGIDLDGQFQYNGNSTGFLWRGVGASNKPLYDHVPPRFFVSAGGDNYITIGGFIDNQEGDLYDESRGGVSQVLMYDGLIGGDFMQTGAWASAAAKGRDLYGNRDFDIRSMANDQDGGLDGKLRMCFPMDDASTDYDGVNKYRNLAYPGFGDTQATGALHITNVANTVQGSGGIWHSETGTASKDYYYIEVFKQAPTVDSQSAKDVTTVDSITTWQTEDYSYPGVAYLAMSLQASDQVNSNTPNITLICHGKKVRIWDGGSLDLPTFTEEWSNNPAWIALDLLCDSDYGLGSTFSPNGTWENLHLQQFYEWSRFCDEGVPDAFGELDFFSIYIEKDLINLPRYSMKLRFGMSDTDDVVVQSVPASWLTGKFQSITSMTTGVTNYLSGGWVTANDYEDGFNSASNRLEVIGMEFKADSSGYHGFNAWLEVRCLWNRVDSDGDAIWPDGETTTTNPTDEWFADNLGVANLGTAGQYEKRCTFNGVFDQKERPVWDALIDIMQTGRAMPAKAGRKIMPVWDRPRDPVGLFTQANIVEGSLEVNYLSPETNPNSIEAEILDADHGYERRTILVDHSSIQDPTLFGHRRVERSQRVGITRRSQTIRDAYYRLNRYALQLRQIKFKVGPDAIHILPGDRVLVAHDVPQYGYSGRLAADSIISNLHPGATDIVNAWTQNGGECTTTDTSLIVTDSTTPPVSGYSNTALGYALPTQTDGTKWYPSAQLGDGGYNRQPNWATQLVAVGDGLYPFAGNTNPIISPLDRIAYEDQVKEFSVYVKEPTYGASQGFRINIYQYVDQEGAFAKLTQAIDFAWDGSGDLIFARFSQSVGSGGTASTTLSPFGLSYDVTEISAGWWRATVFYDNGDGEGQGADGVGRYIQARAYYSFPIVGISTFKDSPTGRNSNLLYFGDPSNVNGMLPDSTTLAWTKANDDVGSNAIANSTTSAPPFYPGDTGADAGQRGYVLNFKNDQADGAANPCMRQTITLPTDWPGVGGAGDMADEPICATFFLRVAADNAAALSSVEAYLWMSTDGTLYTGATLPGWFSNTSNQVRYRIKDFDSTPTITYSDVEPGAANQTNLSATIAPLKQTSITDDANWFQVDVAWKTDTDFPTLYVLAGMRGDSGGTSSVDFWGLRVHGAGSTGASTSYVNHVPHRGTLMWGPLYNQDAELATVTPWTEGTTVTLDRDVTLDGGESYEVYVRSSFSQDLVTGSDVTTKLLVAANEVGTKAARTELKCGAPRGMTPATGDVYSFGKLDKSVEDVVVTEITLNAETLEREITAMEYVEAIYQDTEFGTMGDLTVSDLPPPSIGGDDALYGFGGNGPQGAAYSITAQATPYRSANAEAKAAISISLHKPRGLMPYREMRLWAVQLDSDFQSSSPRQIATLPPEVTSYRYDDSALNPALTYRIYAQRVGWRGTGSSIFDSPHVDVKPVVMPRLPSAPTVAIEAEGFSQIYTVAPEQDGRVASVEGRIGGWVISTPAYSVDPDASVFTSRGIAIGATNSAGKTNFPVVSRTALANGGYGQASLVTTTSAFVDARSTDTTVGEDDYAAALTIPAALDVVSDVLEWASGSASVGPVYAPMGEMDLTTAKRAIPVALIEGYQVRPETLADLVFTLGSEEGRRWSIEGPMDDSAATAVNASVAIEWRWTSGSDVTGETYHPFESKEVYFRKAQFRLVWTRPLDTFQVRLSRFTVKIYVPPLFDPSDVDGGTF